MRRPVRGLSGGSSSSDVWRNRVILQVARDLRAPRCTRHLVLAEDAYNFAALLGRNLRGTRGRALARRAAHIDATVGRTRRLRREALRPEC
jgi:hypothetical protein